jgi:hypothetical protein
LVVILFFIEWATQGVTVAFDLMTGTVSVSQVKAGPAGWCLSFAGYLILPIVIAVMASAIFANQVRTINEKEFDARFDSSFERHFGQPPPPRKKP